MSNVDLFGDPIPEVIEEKVYKRKRLSPFDFTKSLSQTKVNLLDQDPENIKDLKGSMFMINRAFSYYVDTILWANEINQHSNIEPLMFHDFYFYGLKSKSRYSKWSKKINDEDVQLIMSHYNYSERLAIEALELLSSEDIINIRKSRETGGKR